jgi:hypothetical protein
MRTTVTLDPDVARLLKEEEARRRTSFKEVVNDAIRRGLAPHARARPASAFAVRPHRTTLRPGHDPSGFNRLADELEDEALIDKVAGTR